MCKYHYGSKYCAHRSVQTRECVGEKDCVHIVAPVHVQAKQRDCSSEQWYGLYCSKYQRFYCPGKENCGSLESYLSSFNGLIEKRA